MLTSISATPGKAQTSSSRSLICCGSRVYSRLAGYEDLNDAATSGSVGSTPTFRSMIGSQKIWDRGAALTSTLHGFETEMLASEENLLGLMALNRELVGQAEAFDDSARVVLDMDSTESPVHGQQEGSAYNGHFESVCYHPLLLFNQHRRLFGGEAASRQRAPAPRTGMSQKLLLPEIERQQAQEGNPMQVTEQPPVRCRLRQARVLASMLRRSAACLYAIRIPANSELGR